MAIGIKITDNLIIQLGEIKEQLLKELDDAKLKYDIPFDKLNNSNSNLKETIIQIKELNIEVTTENDIINYIKSGNTVYTNIDVLEDIENNALEHVKTIQNKVCEFFNDKDYNIKMEKIDLRTLNITFILYSEYEKARVHVLRDTHGKVFINTIMHIQ